MWAVSISTFMSAASSSRRAFGPDDSDPPAQENDKEPERPASRKPFRTETAICFSSSEDGFSADDFVPYSISVLPSQSSIQENYNTFPGALSRGIDALHPPPRSERKPCPPTVFPRPGRPFRRTSEAPGGGPGRRWKTPAPRGERRNFSRKTVRNRRAEEPETFPLSRSSGRIFPLYLI